MCGREKAIQYSAIISKVAERKAIEKGSSERIAGIGSSMTMLNSQVSGRCETQLNINLIVIATPM